MGSHNRKWLCHIQLVLPLVTTFNFRTGRKNSRPAFTICFAMDTNPNYSTSRMPTAIRPQCQTGSSRKRLYDESIWSRLYSALFLIEWLSKLFLRTGICAKDSGSPLVDRQGTCIGIVSFSSGCARGNPDVYTKFWTAIPFFRQASQNTIPNLPRGPQ